MRFLFTLTFCALSACVSATEPVQFDYMMNCQGCHLPNGEGFPSRNVPKVKDHLGKFLHVEGGREFLIQVPGSAQSDLNDKKLSAVINWMLTTFSPAELPQNFKPYTETEVGKLRIKTLIDVKGAREVLMGRIEKLQLQQQDTGISR